MGIETKRTYNINADTAAGTIANEIKAERSGLRHDNRK